MEAHDDNTSVPSPDEDADGSRTLRCPPAGLAGDGPPDDRPNGPAFIAMMEEIKKLLQHAFRTKNEMTIVVSGPGSAGMETCFAIRYRFPELAPGARRCEPSRIISGRGDAAMEFESAPASISCRRCGPIPWNGKGTTSSSRGSGQADRRRPDPFLHVREIRAILG
jgi:ribosomal protein L37E